MAVGVRARKDAAVLRAAAARRRLKEAAGRLYRPQFSEEQLGALLRYKNRGADHSLTYRHIMSPLYDRLVLLLPTWLAPNAVTLAGFSLIVASHLLLMWHCPQFDNAAPRYVYLATGLSLFAYMVLDNLDGRQARRTASSSPLGHLFDHGCDAFNVTLSGINFIAMLQMGAGLDSLLLMLVVGHLVCYAASQEELFTGAMILREVNGPNEGLILMSMFHVVTALAGPHIWVQQVSILGHTRPCNSWLSILMFVPVTFTVVTNFTGIMKDAKTRGLPLHTTALHVCKSWANFIVFAASFVAWGTFAPDSLRSSFVPALWLSCFNFFHMISKMIVAHLTSTRYPTLLASLTPQVLCAVNAVAGGYLTGRPLLPERPFVLSALAATAAFNAWRIHCMIVQICSYLNVRCLRLGPLRPDAPADADDVPHAAVSAPALAGVRERAVAR